MKHVSLIFPLAVALPALSSFVLAEDAPIKAALQPFVDRHELAGAVTVVASKDKILDISTVGFADIGAGRAMPENALFWIASQSKPITSTALMMLVDEGKVNVNDPVEKYLPEFKGQMVVAEKDETHVLLKKPAHPITVKNVLTHTSGLPFASPLEKPTLDLLPLADRVHSYACLPLDFEPDSKYQYSNEAINTAGRIIEVVSGMPYEEFLQKRIFDPLGMKETTFWPSEEQVSRLAKTYKPNAAKDGLEEMKISQLLYPLSDRTRRCPMPAGGLFSTCRDTARFCQMILNRGTFDGKRYLSEEALQQMTTRQTPPELKDSYGLGWSAGSDWAGHGGAYATNMTVDFKRGLVFVYSVQHAGFLREGGKAQDAFKKAAIAQFAPAQ